MMFWDTIGYDYMADSKEFQERLQDPNLTLRTIIDDPNCFQEIRSENAELMNFLKKENVFRELAQAVLCPVVDDAHFEKNKYSFAHRCCEALALGSRFFFHELVKYDDLVYAMINFLHEQAGNLNHLTVSFYCKLVMSFLSAETYPFLKLLEKSGFLELCIENLEFCAIFELLCAIVNIQPDPAYRYHIKMWYVQNHFAERLLDTLSLDKPSEIHENGAALWAEFIKSLRDIQYNVEVNEDPLLDSLQVEEHIRELLARMFPSDDESNDYSISIIVNGCCVLNTLLETNYIKDSPSAMIQRELLQSANTSVSDSSTFSIGAAAGGNEVYGAPFNALAVAASASPTSEAETSASFLVIDPKRVVETCCAEYASRFMRVIIEGLADENVLERSDDALLACMQIIVNLLNTNFLPTHLELLKVFSDSATHFGRLVEFVSARNSAFSIFNSLLNHAVLYVLYSSTGSEKPLLNFLLKDYDLPGVIRDIIEKQDAENGQDPNLRLQNNEKNNDASAAANNNKSTSAQRGEHGDCATPIAAAVARQRRSAAKLALISRRTFFLKLADHIVHCQMGTLNGDYVDKLLKSSSNYERWIDFNSHQLEKFANRNRSDKVLSTTARSSTNAFEIDEVINVDEMDNNENELAGGGGGGIVFGVPHFSGFVPPSPPPAIAKLNEFKPPNSASSQSDSNAEHNDGDANKQEGGNGTAAYYCHRGKEDQLDTNKHQINQRFSPAAVTTDDSSENATSNEDEEEEVEQEIDENDDEDGDAHEIEKRRRIRSLERYLQYSDDELEQCKVNFDAKFAISSDSNESNTDSTSSTAGAVEQSNSASFTSEFKADFAAAFGTSSTPGTSWASAADNVRDDNDQADPFSTQPNPAHDFPAGTHFAPSTFDATDDDQRGAALFDALQASRMNAISDENWPPLGSSRRD